MAIGTLTNPMQHADRVPMLISSSRHSTKLVYLTRVVTTPCRLCVRCTRVLVGISDALIITASTGSGRVTVPMIVVTTLTRVTAVSYRSIDWVIDCFDWLTDWLLIDWMVCVASLCRTLITGQTSGQIRSASPYAANSDCQWVIESPVGTRVSLQVSDALWVECVL